MESVPSIIFDCGAHQLCAGFGGERGPRLDIPALVGHPRHRGVAMAAGMNEMEVGEEALVKRGMLTVHRPIQDGLVTNWEDMERLWSHVMYSQLRVTPESHCFVTTQPVNAPTSQKEKILEILMETFHTPSLFIGTSQVLSLYAYGLTTGLVLDSGRDRTMAVPVHEGYALGRHVTETPIAGEVLTDYLGALLRKEGYSLGTPEERTLLNDAKESLCYVRPSSFSPYVAHADSHNMSGQRSASLSYSLSNGLQGGLGYHSEASEAGVEHTGEETFFHLPDGQAIPLNSHRHRTTEILFNFSLLPDGQKFEPLYKVRTEMGEIFAPSFKKGISWLPFAAIHSCDAALRPQLYANMVLAGNNLTFPGARQRLEIEIERLYRENHSSEAVTPINVRDMACRGYSAWLGASILSRMSMFPHLVVTRQEYQESGLRVVHCKSL